MYWSCLERIIAVQTLGRGFVVVGGGGVMCVPTGPACRESSPFSFFFFFVCVCVCVCVFFFFFFFFFFFDLNGLTILFCFLFLT